ncbi:helicase-associated domain-containing protein [Microbacterium sp. LRZ72]|uniref:helicase-associated domain-containing protein n=1 Tax=Microbacterium sp. LRZ72 TaxID=2942481 RepID=UPI0029B2455D|nr:helicase-associated domain-containing protein [Microbacterium sp. LRZ72]MDX2375931.1 helicase-associated domain-containing protein [Microbacterium sp. LRZ72]
MAGATRDLAARLAALPDDELARLLHRRGVAPLAGWRDFFDAAEALTDEAAVTRAVATLSATDLEHLDAAGAGEESAASAVARDLLLLDEDGTPLPVVARAIARTREGSQTVAHDEAPAADEVAERAAAERAFTSAAALADILIRAIRTPLARIGAGTIGAADRRALTEDLQQPDDVDALVALADWAGLLAGERRRFAPTSRADDWLADATAQRWSEVAAVWHRALPAAVRAEAPGSLAPPAEWETAFPADAGWPARAALLRRTGIAWGLLTPEGNVPTWTRLLPEHPEQAANALAALMPHEVDRIYLQNDLTAISPGPLAAARDVRLRRLAQRESHAQASTYRFTAETIAGALTEGETAESILAFLADVSLTGVPQPLEYLVQTTAERHGLVRVGVDPTSPDGQSRSRVTSSSTQVLDTLEVDQSLRPLGLVRSADGSALVSRVERDTALWALVDARYPAVAVDAHDRVEKLRRHRVAVAPDQADPLTAYAPLIARLRTAGSDDADADWLGRELEAAVRARDVVAIDVRLPGGETRAFVLEATGIGGGRLRGREPGAEVERTLPVSSIVSVRRQ